MKTNKSKIMKTEIGINLEGLLTSLKEDGYTRQESLALMFTAVGKQADEIADEMHISVNTARMHIKNSKDTNGLSKSSELSGYVICKALGVNYSDVVKQIKDLARVEVRKRTITKRDLKIRIIV
ncbi:LuxR C-terminal-related transcriptional regulator [Dysgonomonas sp. Marseille-P4361]|uniref:helix-turn-helix transcriptional regulator n=1 Tax=Dysgonomonas sp. Marseille-P4361 TaxID=2161820 RepID=UPI000D55F663|nr:LuxR C-terminal-related transcriptional regulator [Dysgonomonas sp. Marseille-P4361]